MGRDVGTWLEELGLGVYSAAFAENCVDDTVLPDLTAEDLRDMGVTAVGHRRKLLAAIAALRAPRPSEPQASLPPPAMPEGERRQVTVLFADICGFTGLSSSIDSEELHALLAAYFDHVDGIIRDHGGTVDKHIGDSVMALFGAPVAHGNDAERAVRAAVAIQAAMPGLSARIGRRIETHIGVASGQVVASGIGGDTHYTVIGDSVNLAARLTDRAEAGEIFVSANVQRTVTSVFATTDMGEVPVKGLAAPVRVFSVEGTATAGARRSEGPFVGRQAEIRQIRGALETCLEARTGQLVCLRGEAGIGKSRLTDEICRLAADSGFACHRALILDFGVGKGQDPIRMLVRSLLGCQTGCTEETRTAVLDEGLASGLIPPEAEVQLRDLLDLPQTPAGKALHDAMDNATRNARKRAAVTALAGAPSRQRPQLIVLEDLHWADDFVLRQLADLCRAAAGHPMLLVVTTRIQGDPLDAVWRGAIAGTPFMTLDLGPLTEADAMAMAAGHFGTRDRFARACIERAAGNPLFLEQLLRSAEETGTTEVPGSVQSIVQARLDTLPPADKAAVQAASVLGQRFSLDALRHLIADDRHDCSRLIEHHLVRRQGDDFLFTHALIRDGVHGSLLRARRAELHLRAADWYAGGDLSLRADHLERAGDPRAARAYHAAAQVQIDALRLEKARQLAERGLAVADDPADIHALDCQLGELLRELGEPERSILAYEEALARAATDVERCRAWLGMAEGMRIVERIAEALALLDRAQPVAEAEGLPAMLMQLHHLRGNLLFPRGDIAGCEAGHRQSLQYAAEIGSAAGEARGLGGLGDAAYVAGRMQTAHDTLSRCVGICRAHGFVRIEVANAAQVCHTLLFRLQFREALDLARATIGTARRVEHHRGILNALIACQLAATELADWTGAEAFHDQALDLAERLGALRFRNEVLASDAVRLAATGREAEAMAAMETVLASAREHGISFGGPRMLGALARISGDRAVQDRALAEGEQVIAGGCVGHNQPYFYRDAIEVMATRADWAEVTRFADALAAFTAGEPLPWSDYHVARARALAERGTGASDAGLIARLRQLRRDAGQIGLAAALPALDRALGAEG